MPRQKHDPGQIKSTKAQQQKGPEYRQRERRKRSLPMLYPGWQEDRRPLREVKALLKERLERKAEEERALDELHNGPIVLEGEAAERFKQIIAGELPAEPASMD